jgi:hypothetical protein
VTLESVADLRQLRHRHTVGISGGGTAVIRRRYARIARRLAIGSKSKAWLGDCSE